MTHDRPGSAFQMLSKSIAYLKLSSVKAAEVPDYVEAAAGTQGWIIDIRNYPSEFVVFALGSHFVDRATEFARFTVGDLRNPGAFHWTPSDSLTPSLRAAPRAVLIGSTTAGADGNVSQFSLPGGLRTMFSGIGVFYPDKGPAQRVGVAIDIPVVPTIAGIREGRDEVLEAALRYILGPSVSTRGR